MDHGRWLYTCSRVYVISTAGSKVRPYALRIRPSRSGSPRVTKRPPGDEVRRVADHRGLEVEQGGEPAAVGIDDEVQPAPPPARS
jgi:hypothetical protein